jgi:hypothetical protein
MRKRPAAGAALALLLGCVVLRAAAPADIAADALLEHIRFLASDELEGRANGSEGLEAASRYIARQFEEIGLQPGGVDGDWFQPFELIAGLQVGAPNLLTVRYPGGSVSFDLGESYYPLAAPARESLSTPSTELRDLPLVFAGHGLAVPALGYDDYADLDAGDRAVLIFSHEPQEHDRQSRLNGTRPMPQTTLQAKAALARRHGARVLIVVGDPAHDVDEAHYGIFDGDPDAEDLPIPVLRVRRTEAQPIVDAFGLDAVARQIDGDLMPRSRPLDGARVDYVEHLAKNRRVVRNVVGILPGSDPALARETIVIGAHYDHVGFGGRLSVVPERTGEIHNGADDNASGTASIIEIARAAMARRDRFPRTLIFAAFAGEERGLLGSARYADAPPLPIADTIAMLNLDMVGRAGGAVDISGLEVSPSMEADLRAAIEGSGTTLRIGRAGPGAGRSDDYNFIARRIPAINFFTDFHDDYHAPGDDWQKIDTDGTRQVAALAFELAAHRAARDSRPEFEPRPRR